MVVFSIYFTCRMTYNIKLLLLTYLFQIVCDWLSITNLWQFKGNKKEIKKANENAT